MYPLRNSFEMKAHDVEAKWHTPVEKLKRATAVLRKQNMKNAVIIKKLDI